MKRTIFLVGYMGSGKSTIGRKLALKLGWRFLDTDIFIENRFRKKVADIFEQEGEAVFRRREHVILEELSGMEQTVISTGGGLPCHSGNMDLMNLEGLTIYLYHSNDMLEKRLELCKRTRPSIRNKSGDELRQHIERDMQSRAICYRKAHITINAEKAQTNKEEELFATEIIETIEAFNPNFFTEQK